MPKGITTVKVASTHNQFTRTTNPVRYRCNTCGKTVVYLGEARDHANRYKI